jgi:ferredoxin
VRHWDRDWPACDEYRSPYGFAKLTSHIETVLAETNLQKKKELLRSETMFNLWQSILRGAGVITGCRRCADVCPVGDDYAMLADALELIEEDTQAKQLRLVDMVRAQEKNDLPEPYKAQERWIGSLIPEKSS